MASRLDSFDRARGLQPAFMPDRDTRFRLAGHVDGSDSEPPNEPGPHDPGIEGMIVDDFPPDPEALTDRSAPLPGFGDTLVRDIKAMPSDLWRDTKKVYTSVPNLLILGMSYGGVLAVQQTGPDDTIETSLRGKDMFSDDWNTAFGALGNPATHFALAGACYALGQQTQDAKTYDVSKKLFSALLINGMSTLVGKVATWDDSPNGEWGTFPSGHTSSTFCLASVIHQEYGPLAGAPLYGLGTLVAMSRLDDEEHYFSDVLMGAVLGLVVGHTVAGEEQIEVFGGHIVPYADPDTGSAGIAWVKHFE
jgi:hypothetical protein